MSELQEVTVRMSPKLYAKLVRLADQAYQSRDSYIEGALAHIVREVMAHQRHMRQPDGRDMELPADARPQDGSGYL